MNKDGDATDALMLKFDLPLPVPTGVAATILQSLSAQVSVLHSSGRVHRSISLATIEQDSLGAARLATASSVCWLGRTPITSAWLPPELHSSLPIELPANIEAARATLKNAGILLDPRQIDIYQLGAMLCQLVTGEPVISYLRNSRTKMLVPELLRPIIERALGCDRQSRFVTVEEFNAMLTSAFAEVRANMIDIERVSPESSKTKSDTTPSVIASRARDTDKSVGPASPVETRSSVDALPFQKLGHFEILLRIGQGGMGDVYLGYEKSLDRKVAIKVLPAEFARQPDFVRRFRAEATAAAKLIHPNVIQIFFIGEAEGHHFFAMQFVEGETLAELLKRKGHLSVDATIAIVEQVFAGLSAAHMQGLVHRDIKPGNILLDRYNHRALLADFGLVKSLQTSSTGKTVTGVVMGTADYMPPEQARGKEVDHRADLYSMGVLMYQMLSGRLPFVADSPTALIFQHVYEQPPPLCEAAPDVPKALADVIEKLLRKSPDERYQNAEQVIAELRATRSKPAEANVDDSRGSNRRKDEPSPASDLDSLPQLPAGLTDVQPQGWWDRMRDRAASLLRRHSPELLQKLQNTQQQFDGAIAEYERRKRRCKQLSNGAESVLAELKTQAKAQRAVSTNDPTIARTADDLDQQVADQEEQLGTIRLNLAKVNAVLQQLKSQRDLLNARLLTAQASAKLSGGGKRRSLMSNGTLLATVAAIVLCALFMLPNFAKKGIDSQKPITIASREIIPPVAGSKQSGNQSTTTVESLAEIDMLQQVDLSRDVFSGIWQKNGSSLVGGAGGNLYLPTKVPEDYELKFSIKRIEGNDTLIIGFMMSGRQGMMAFDFGGALGCGLYLDHAEPRIELAPGAVFQNHVPATIILTIHPGHLHVKVNDRTIVDWHGDPSRLSLYSAHGCPCRESPFLVISNATYQIASATLVAIAPEIVPSQIPRLESKIDIMPLFDLKRDAALGIWTIADQALYCPGIQKGEIYLPVEVPQEYTVYATVENQSSLPGDPVFTIGGGASLNQIVVSRNSGIGLDVIDGRRWNNNETYLSSIKPGTQAQIEYTVTKHGVRFELDGRTLIDWRGDLRRLSLPSDWALPDGRRLYIGTTGQFLIRNLKIGPPLEKPIPSEHAPFEIGQRVDLLRLVNPIRDSLSGTWAKDGNSLRVWGDVEHNMLTIRCDVPTEYKLTVVVARVPGGKKENDCMFIKLPIGESMLDIGIDAYASTVSGIYLDGNEVDKNEFAIANVIPFKIRQELTFLVRRTGVKVVTPDRTIIDWIGNTERLTSHSAHATPEGQISIGSWNTGFRFDRLEIEPLEPTSFPPAFEPGINGKLLPLINAERDSRKGNWKLTNEGLVNMSNADCRLRIPVAPPKQYLLTADIERRTGSSQFCFGLVVNGNSCGAVLDVGSRSAGLEQLDDQDLSDKLNLTQRFYQGLLLPLGKTVKVRCFVLPDTVVIICDDKEIVRWHGDPRRLSLNPGYLPPNYSDADRTHLWFSMNDSQFLIRDLELQPLSDEVAETIAKTFSGVYPTTSRISDPLSESELEIDSLVPTVSEKLVILGAKVFSGNESLDITKQLASAAAESGRLMLVVDEALASISQKENTDSQARTPISLRLRFDLNGVAHIRTFGENEVVHLGSPPRTTTTIPKDFKLVDARVGVGLFQEAAWEDVTFELNSFVKKDGLSVTAEQLSKVFYGRDFIQNRNVPRSLFVRYQLQGRERTLLIPNGTPLFLGAVPLNQGLIASIFDGTELQRQHASRIDWNVDANFGFGAPAPGINPDDFSVRWQGVLRAPTTGKYTLFLKHDDGGRLWIDGKTLIDNWGSAGEEQVDIVLTDQPHSITVEYCERQVGAGVFLEWQSDSIPRQIIPPRAFFHDPRLALQLGVK